MSSPLPVTLQISLAPSDYAHARFLLQHQVSTWRNQVAEILLTVDFHRSAGRFSARWEEGRELILPLARSIPGARVVEVDYSASAQAGVASEFFGNRTVVPAKDFRGGPYYSYFFGLSVASHDHVLHADSDMLFGGQSSSWLTEALAEEAANPHVLFSAPLPGPPSADGRLHSQQATPVPERVHAHDFDTMSTRLFLLSRARFRATVGVLTPRRPSLRNTLKALVERNPPQDLPEHLFTDAMRPRGLVRREFLGSGPGMWHLHPPYRCADFYRKLPDLIRRCECNDIPDAQRGDHDVNASLVDWSEAIAAMRHNRWWRRLLAR
jgi:hypothetical protein